MEFQQGPVHLQNGKWGQQAGRQAAPWLNQLQGQEQQGTPRAGVAETAHP